MTTDTEPLRQYTIYDHPRDHPESFVVREWLIGAGTVTPGQAWGTATLASARDLVPPGLVCLGREPQDDPVIIETWI